MWIWIIFASLDPSFQKEPLCISCEHCEISNSVSLGLTSCSRSESFAHQWLLWSCISLARGILLSFLLTFLATSCDHNNNLGIAILWNCGNSSEWIQLVQQVIRGGFSYISPSILIYIFLSKYLQEFLNEQSLMSSEEQLKESKS